MSECTDVVIVGAGPAGLLLAGDLAAAGVSCAVLERRGSESNLTRAFAVHARTLELLDARGVADELIATGSTVDSLQFFDGISVDLSVLPTRFPFLLITPQYHTERLLEDRARQLGVEMVRGATAVAVRQDPDGAEVDVRAENGTVTTRRAGYLVGADGMHSAVRRALGLRFPGHSAVQSVMLADVRMREAPTEVLVVGAVAAGFAFIVSFGDGWHRVIAWDRRRQLPDSAPVELDEIRRITGQALGSDYGMHDPRWMSRFHSDERQVTRYRTGRVFLAGDAAHVHSPAGGQGMNAGLQDAANLGWKLAAAIHGQAPPGLLDTYHTERHPVGAAVLRGSGTLLRAAKLHSPLLRNGRRLVGSSLTRIAPVNRRIAGAASGIDIAYPASRSAHPRVGTRAPDSPLAGTDRLYETLRGERFVLLSPRRNDLDEWTGRVDHATPADDPSSDTLIRPDGYVAWTSDQADPTRRTTLRAALTAWCATPPNRAVAERHERDSLRERDRGR